MRIDVGEMMKGMQRRIPLLAVPERIIGELLDMVRDSHRIMLKIEEVTARLDKLAQTWDERLSSMDVSPERVDRIEKALFNIERATLGVEASLSALPRAVRMRIDRSRKPGAGDTPPAPRGF
ncbi:MAG: hypothetical protein ACXVQY_03475 [Actinomycetota bacterium]